MQAVTMKAVVTIILFCSLAKANIDSEFDCVDLSPYFNGHASVLQNLIRLEASSSHFSLEEEIGVDIKGPVDLQISAFLLQARKPGLDSPQGAWSSSDIPGIPYTCYHDADTLIGQTVGNTFKATWKATEHTANTIEFVAMVRVANGTYWSVSSSPILKRSNQGNTGTPPQQSSTTPTTTTTVEPTLDSHDPKMEDELAAIARERQRIIDEQEDRMSEGQFGIEEEKDREQHDREMHREEMAYERQLAMEKQRHQAILEMEIRDKEEHDRIEHERHTTKPSTIIYRPIIPTLSHTDTKTDEPKTHPSEKSLLEELVPIITSELKDKLNSGATISTASLKALFTLLCFCFFIL